MRGHTRDWDAPTGTDGSPAPALGFPQIPALGAGLTRDEVKQVALGHLARRRVLEPLSAKHSKWAQPQPPTQPHPTDLVDETRIIDALNALGYPQMVGARQVHTKTNVLRLLFDLPALTRPPIKQERQALAALLEADALFVNRAAHSLLHEAPVCEAAERLFQNWGPTDLETLAALPPQYAQAWGQAAASCYPKPHPKQVRALKDQLLTLSTDHGFVDMVDALVEGLITQECEAGGDIDNWESLLQQVAAFPGTPLGDTPVEVDTRLRAALPQFVPIPSMSVLASMLLAGQ